MEIRKTNRRYALSQFAIHGKLMMMRYKDISIKFDYYCEEFNEWRDCSVPQWEEDTKYRVKQLNK